MSPGGRWNAYRHKQYSRDLPGNAAPLRPGSRADIMGEYESQPRTRLLLPDDLGRPVSPLAISSPPCLYIFLILSSRGLHLY